MEKLMISITHQCHKQLTYIAVYPYLTWLLCFLVAVAIAKWSGMPGPNTTAMIVNYDSGGHFPSLHI